MAFQPHSNQENTQNRQQILQDIQQQKKRLLLMNQQGPTPGSGPAGTNHGGRPTGDNVPPTIIRNSGEAHQMAVNQRQAMEHAQATSPGYFISQDSSYGNLILPVIPRVESE